MNSREAETIGMQLSDLLEGGSYGQAHDLLTPILAQKIPFTLLGRIGAKIGSGLPARVNLFLDQVAAGRTMGGWVIIGDALRVQYFRYPGGPAAFERCRAAAILADVWYGADILGERLPGSALAADIEASVALLTPWRTDSNRWVRRMVGVGVHVWAKRARGDPHKIPQAELLLEFLEPMFTEQDSDALKGVGWGIKTIGKYYPSLSTQWLAQQASRGGYRALMLSKALTYLPVENRRRVESARR
jgi:hypothetical protein